MKTILLLTFTVLVSSVPMENSDKKILGELIEELDIEVKRLLEDNKRNETFVTELQMHNCKGVFFCLAEQELIKEVSGLSGAEFDRFRTDKKLMRNLHKYNQRHVETCKPALKDQEMTLLDFLKNLLTCARHVNGQKS
uniref:Interleukin 4/13A n=1 Tax=Carassius langsdorfii TaxID=138676 RepID=A0A0F7R2J2_CARLG|nr:interleukin 4/13A precursor [Carassius langsdorfii]